MANPRAIIRQADITRAVKGALSAGMQPGRVEVRPDGTVVIYAAGEQADTGENPCDRLLK